jgi:hypothetical protein
MGCLAAIRTDPRPLAAVRIARGHARLVRIELGLDGTFKLPELHLDISCVDD